MIEQLYQYVITFEPQWLMSGIVVFCGVCIFSGFPLFVEKAMRIFILSLAIFAGITMGIAHFLFTLYQKCYPSKKDDSD